MPKIAEMNPESQDEFFMSLALEQATVAEQNGEVPVGAVAVVDGEVIAKSGNLSIQRYDPTAHAEIVVLRRAALSLQNYRLPQATVYVTLEPCAMCFSAMVHARIQRLVFGAADPKSGVLGGALDWSEEVVFNHKPVITGGVLADSCSKILKQFFSDKRR